MVLWLERLVDSSTQCWSCQVFDRLLSIISDAAAMMYDKMAVFGIILMCVFIAFYLLYVVWKNLSGDVADFMYQKSVKPVLINSIVVAALLGLGVMFPRFVTTFTMEPVADMTILYSQTTLQKTDAQLQEMVPYEPGPMSDDGFFRPQLRDKIIKLVRLSTTQFQAMMNLGLLVMDGAFSWTAILGIGSFIKHIILFLVGFMLTWGFFKLFVRFCFYFVDVILALTMFAFFFPLGLVFFIFKNSESADWVKKLGSNIAPGMLKRAIGSIVTLATVVITYVVIMVFISRFFADDAVGGSELVAQVMSGDIFAAEISTDNAAIASLGGIVVMMYVVQYLSDQIGQVADSVIEAFGLKDVAQSDLTKLKDSPGKALADNVMKIGEDSWNTVKKVGGVIINAAGPKKEEKKEEEKKDDKKDDKK